MIRTLRRKYETAKALFQKGGAGAVLERGNDRALLALSKRKTHVRIDGCRFDIQEIRDPFTRLLLLKGVYEKIERRAAVRHICPDTPVLELGGCIGVVACTTNRLLRNPRAHVVVEANPLVIPQLQRNRDANGCQFEIVNCAVAYDAESVTFCPAGNFVGNSLNGNGELPPVTVGAMRLSQLVAERGFRRFTLLCDIEGSECAMVEQDGEVLRNAELIVLESHPGIVGASRAEQTCLRLKELGFEQIEDHSALYGCSVSVWKNRAAS